MRTLRAEPSVRTAYPLLSPHFVPRVLFHSLILWPICSRAQEKGQASKELPSYGHWEPSLPRVKLQKIFFVSVKISTLILTDEWSTTCRWKINFEHHFELFVATKVYRSSDWMSTEQKFTANWERCIPWIKNYSFCFPVFPSSPFAIKSHIYWDVNSWINNIYFVLPFSISFLFILHQCLSGREKIVFSRKEIYTICSWIQNYFFFPPRFSLDFFTSFSPAMPIIKYPVHAPMWKCIVLLGWASFRVRSLRKPVFVGSFHLVFISLPLEIERIVFVLGMKRCSKGKEKGATGGLRNKSKTLQNAFRTFINE